MRSLAVLASELLGMTGMWSDSGVPLRHSKKNDIVADALKVRKGSTFNEKVSSLRKHPFASAVAIATHSAVAADLLTHRLM